MIIEINERMPSINHLYGHSKFGTKYMKNAAKQLRVRMIQEATIQLEKQGYNQKDWINKLLRVRVEIHEDWWTKKKTVKVKDIANKEKFLIDSIMKALNLDDCFIWEHTMVKVDSDIFKSRIHISVYKEENGSQQ